LIEARGPCKPRPSLLLVPDGAACPAAATLHYRKLHLK
jgi:hypothetical protein